MNKNEFIDVLEKSLIRLPKADRDDILSDYEAHFAIGLENGKTEEEVSASLGDPYELATTYLENLPEGAKGAPAAVSEETEASDSAENTEASPTYTAPSYGAPQTEKKAPAATAADKDSPDAGSVVIVVFLSIAAVFVLFGIASVWVALPGTAFGCIVGAFALIALGVALMTQSVLAGVGAILLSLGLAALSVLTIIGCIASIKGIIWLIKKFIELCKNILEGGSN